MGVIEQPPLSTSHEPGAPPPSMMGELASPLQPASSMDAPNESVSQRAAVACMVMSLPSVTVHEP